LLWILSSGGTEPRLKKHLTDVLRCLSASLIPQDLEQKFNRLPPPATD
jgi:hypothetical protein